MPKFKVIAGDVNKGFCNYNSKGMYLNKKEYVPFIDVMSLEETDRGIEITLFDGRRILVEGGLLLGKAFAKTVKIALFNESKDINIRQNQYEQRKLLDTKVKPPLTTGKILLFFLVVFIGLIIVIMIGSRIDNSNNNTYVSNKSEIEQAKLKVSKEILTFKYTKQDYPKLYKRWGDTAMLKINELIPKIALHVAHEKTCDKVEVVDLSDKRSQPKDNIVFYADCANNKRFYVSEADLINDKSISAEQDKEIDKLLAVNQCDTAIKMLLQNPNTFEQHIMDTDVSAIFNGNIIVHRGFSAKNSLGMKIDYHARCTLDSNYKIDPEFVRIEQK
ncbi:hypothetical protein [Neisseria montereyensis]|uniref:Uncharacterized protein n=1 Tax=Neisseria montereyensis TaxID=2973938 RepID=A0ABT2FEV7_9NEIS|nr:hypothetical protein [Neisseria montereyensis]MCS4534754.1 hypothetical protein [Neisseria montereyensis]